MNTLIDTTPARAFAARGTTSLSIAESAELLPQHGAAHLSPIKRIDLAERPLTRRQFLIGASSVALGAALAGCVLPPADPAAQSPAQPASAPATSAYPRTITDKFGPVELRAKPERIMVYYANAQLDALLALGVKPALIMTYQSFELAPWQRDAADVPMLFFSNGMINYETVLAEGIDLILTAEYPTTTQAARDERVANQTDIPVVSLDQADFEAQLRIVGDMLGLEAAASAQITELQTLFADFKPARMPKTVKAFGNYEDGKFWMYREASGLGAMLKRFGLPALLTPDNVGDQTIDPEAVQAISFEAMAELEADLLIGTDFGEGYRVEFVANSPLFQQLPVAKDGRFVTFDKDESFATCYGSILSIPAAKAALTKALDQYAAANG